MRDVRVADSISVSESAFVSKANASGDKVGLVVSRGGVDPRVASSDLGADGRLVSRVEGRASDKKDAELRTAQLFVQRLNVLGGQWGEPSAPADGAPEEGVDALARDQAGNTLKIQVTTPETRAWAATATQPGAWTDEGGLDETVEAVRGAIERKHLKAHPDIHLVLDATDSTRFALTQVVQTFREGHGAWARGRFAEVWIAGPVVDAVARLDTP